MKRRNVCLAMAGAMLCIAAGTAGAQAFPSKTVTIVVPFPPGGGADTLARILSPRLSALWKQPVIVENKPGASGHIGTAYVTNQAADGHTLVMASTAAISEKNINKLAPVSLVSAESYAVVLNPSVPAKNINELISYAKANPGKLHFGSSGTGAASHLSGELFQAKAGIEMVHVPYKGTGQAVTDLLAGHIELMFAPIQTIMPHLPGGRVKVIAVTGSKPVHALPAIPPVTGSGLPGYEALGWFGLLAPAGTPKATVDKLNADINGLLATPEVRKEMLDRGAEPGSMKADEFARFIRQEQDKWSTVMKQAGVVIE